ncbi:S-glutathionyl-(chloro)hydroquinone reductase [Ptychographa xylographoides]|nr:S-glutathionyl-(chloro)hydroquinone reductase [Ptychographa xylographoides]
MYNLLTFTVCIVLLLLDPVSAAPTKLPLSPRSFKVARTVHGSATKRNHIKALTKSYAKWNIPLPAGFVSTTTSDHAVSNAATGETGEVTNTPAENDAEYLAPISIGGQTIMMDFDTGSSDLWVFNTMLPTADTTGHTLYNPSQSSSFNLLNGQTYSIHYGDGSTSAGIVGTDTVNIGGATVTSQAVELPTTVSGSFIGNTASNGLVGLAFSSLNTVKPTQQQTFFDNIRASLAQPVFTANLKHATTGSYEFGTIDPTQFAGSIAYTPIDTASGFWQFPSNSFAVGGGDVQQNAEANPAIADTGTSLLLVDDSLITGYYTQVNGAFYSQSQGGVIFPCDATLPDLDLAMGPSYMATIPGSEMNFAQVGQGTHRALIVRKLKGLEDIIPFTSVHWHMQEKGGWRFATADEKLPGENTRPDPVHPTYTHLRDIYFEVDPEYKGRFTVPTLYDIKQKKIVSNESSEIIRMFYTEFDDLLPEQYKNVDLFPAALQAEIEKTNEWTYNDINNGVYKTGFASSQEAYESAIKPLFTSLAKAESHLSTSFSAHKGPYYHGPTITEADVRLYTTIIRFDPVYVQHFKCNIRDIRSGFPALHRWLRHLYWEVPAFGDTTVFEHIKRHYTRSHGQINPFAITPVGPVPDVLRVGEEVRAVEVAVEAAGGK